MIPYGWGYYQQKQYLTRVNYAIDPTNRLYAVYERNDASYRKLRKRFADIMARYEAENAGVMQAYRDAEQELESSLFWEKYLA